MNNDKRTTRELAIEWFNSKASIEKTRICDTNTEIVGTVRRWETLTGREIEMLYLSEHTTETESKKEEGKEGDILEVGFIEDALDFYWRDAITNLERKDLGDIERRNYESQASKAKALISLAPQLAKENKELKERIDKMAFELRRAKTFEELATDIIKEKEKQNKLLREALRKMYITFNTHDNVDDWLILEEAKQALNQ